MHTVDEAGTHVRRSPKRRETPVPGVLPTRRSMTFLWNPEPQLGLRSRGAGEADYGREDPMTTKLQNNCLLSASKRGSPRDPGQLRSCPKVATKTRPRAALQSPATSTTHHPCHPTFSSIAPTLVGSCSRSHLRPFVCRPNSANFGRVRPPPHLADSGELCPTSDRFGKTRPTDPQNLAQNRSWKRLA